MAQLDSDMDDSPDNLARLAHLTRDSIMNALQARYERNQIYTHIGDILVAINPYQQLPIYTLDIQEQYKGAASKQLPPHIFGIADRAYEAMVRSKIKQCFVISGESGAGKTESTKLLVSHIIELCRAGNTELEEMIKVVNPLLEAFGNAKTGLNDNSSRFGKYLELSFTDTGAIRGANMRHYLLEKSRVTKRSENELNFHIFYQLYAGLRDEGRLNQYNLIRPSDHAYLQGRGAPSDGEILGGKYCGDWVESIKGLRMLGFEDADVRNMTAVLAAILHIGDTMFTEAANDSVFISSQMEKLDIVSRLLMVNFADLQMSLQHVHVHARNEVVLRNLNLEQAIENRDAFAKSLYARMFSWIMREINRVLDTGDDGLVMGCLDIFGFEAFQHNSLEQLCINVTNEQLQNYFNKHIFIMEQEEYARENVDFSRIEFIDNQDTLDLFLKKPMALLPILEEESHFPKGTDLTFTEKCVATFSAHPAFEAPRSYHDLHFTLTHYAGTVTYTTKGFLVKNRDTLSPDITGLLRASGSDYVSSLYLSDGDSATVGTNKRQNTMSAGFRSSLTDLVTRLYSCEPHFVRCIKPNQQQRKQTWNKELVSRQLQYSGVLETIKIRKMGYSYRVPFETFVRRYKVLVYKYHENPPPTRDTCRRICQAIQLGDYQLGTTKVFMKYHHATELAALAKEQADALVFLQKIVKAHVARQKHAELLAAKRKQDLLVADLLQYIHAVGHNKRRHFVELVNQDEAQRAKRDWLRHVQREAAEAEAARREAEWHKKKKLKDIANEPKKVATRFVNGYMIWFQNEHLDIRVGPLPYPWKQKVDSLSGRYYFKHLETKRTTWVDPRSYEWRKHDPLETVGDEMPYGWDEGETEDGTVFYVNHLDNTHHRMHPRAGIRQHEIELEAKRQEQEDNAARTMAIIRALREKRRRLMMQLAQASDDDERADVMARVLAMDHAIQKEQAQLGAVKAVTDMLLANMRRLRERRSRIDIDQAVKTCAAIWLRKVRRR